MTFRILFIGYIFCALHLLSCQTDTTIVDTSDGPIVMSTDEYLKTIGEIYMFGYPLVLMDITQKVTTNIESPHPSVSSAPINQLGHYREFPDHTMTKVVKPNVDTYYSIAWFDLSVGPHVLSMPATDRYYLLPFLDAYSNVFASPGTRTTGTDAQTLLITGPDWKGLVPDNMTLIQSPTNMVWMLGRIQVNSPEDGDTVVRSIQDKMELVPLSQYENQNYTSPLGQVNPAHIDVVPSIEIQELDVETFFTRLADLMVDNPPSEADSIIVRKMTKIGLVPGQTFSFNLDNLILKTKIKALPGYIHNQFKQTRKYPDTALLVNGWKVLTEGLGTYGIDYKRRAFIDFIGLGACIPEDAIYPNTTTDINGDELDGGNRYHIHFESDNLPPVNAFWSLTAYNSKEFLVKNDLNRFALGDRDDLVYNADGSLDLFIQSQPPENEEQHKNWLPIPEEGPFYLTLRLYWPKEKALTGKWDIPFVIPVE